jgi:hypothetical protein
MGRGGLEVAKSGMRSRARILGGMAVVVLASGSFVFAVTTAGAASPAPIDVSGDHVVCNTVTGGIKFGVPLVNGGTATSNAISVKGKLDGCTDTDNPAVHLAGATFAGTLTGTTNDCNALSNVNAFPASPITVTWRTATGTPKLTSPKSSVAVSELSGLEYGADWASYVELQTGTRFETAPLGVTGAFSGGDAGAASSLDIVTSLDDVNASEFGCNGAGVKALNFAIGQIALG